MSTTSRRAWCNALLQGVYKHKAAQYRYIIHKKNAGKFKLFPTAFKGVATGQYFPNDNFSHPLFMSHLVIFFLFPLLVLYGHFLERCGEQGPFSDKRLREVLTELAACARDLCGRRNTGTKPGSRSRKPQAKDETV
jgi:hypothetical protein